MKEENFNINEMYTFNIILYPGDKSNYAFQEWETEHHISGILFAKDRRNALEKLYEDIGCELYKTTCSPNIRHFVTEELLFMNKDKMFCTGFTTI